MYAETSGTRLYFPANQSLEGLERIGSWVLLMLVAMLLAPEIAPAASSSVPELNQVADRFAELLSGPVARAAGIGAVVVGGVMFAFGGDMGAGFKALAGAAIGLGVMVGAGSIVTGFIGSGAVLC